MIGEDDRNGVWMFIKGYLEIIVEIALEFGLTLDEIIVSLKRIMEEIFTRVTKPSQNCYSI